MLRVNHIDQDGYIELSKHNVTANDRKLGQDKYRKGKHVFSIVNRVAQLSKRTIEEVKSQVIYPLTDEYEDIYETLKLVASEQEECIYKNVEIDNDISKHFFAIVKDRLDKPPVKVFIYIYI